jgi:hypothetical protein
MFAPRSGLSLVICTGHGPLRLGDTPHSNKPKSAKDAGPCLFASTGAAPPVEPMRLAKSSGAEPGQLSNPILSDLVSERSGNAAPPPARAPPRE